MGQFHEVSAVTDLGDGRFGARIHEGWEGTPGAPLGGYTMALAAKALGAALGRDPLTVTAHFLRPAAFGEVEVETEVLREGRSQSVGRAVLRQEGEAVAALLGTYGSYAEDDDDAVVETPPYVPPRDECIDPRPEIAGLQDEIDVLTHVGGDAWHTEPLDEPRGIAWLRFSDGEPIDAYGLLVLGDYGPPLPWFIGRWGLVPTIELTVQIRRAPVEGWVRLAANMPWLDSTFVADQMQWDEAGRIVLTARQLARLVRA